MSYYVPELEFGERDREWQWSRHRGPKYTGYLQRRGRDIEILFGKAIQEEKIIPSHCKSQWINNIEEGHPEVIVTLLCLLLPKLETIKIEQHFLTRSHLGSALEHILNNAPASALTSLKKVYVNARSIDRNKSDFHLNSETLECIELILLLPSLDELHFQDAGGPRNLRKFPWGLQTYQYEPLTSRY